MHFLKQVHSKNFINLSLNQGVNILVALLITPYVYQTLGDDTFGLVNLSLSIIMLFTILVNYGFHLNGPKRLALIKNDLFQKQKFINEVLWTRLGVSTLLFLFLLFSIKILGLFAEQESILLFTCIILFNEAVMPMFILQGLDRISWLAYGNAISKAIYGFGIFLILEAPSEAKWVNFIFGSSAFIVNSGLLFMIYRVEKIKLVLPRISAVLFRVKENFSYFFSTIAGHISIHGGMVILSNYVTDDDLGKYALAQRVAFLLRLIPMFIVQSILQQATRMYEKDKVAYKSYISEAYKASLLFTLVIGILFSLGAPYVIRIIGGEYVDLSAGLLRIMAFIPLVSALNVKNITKILATEKKAVLVKASWVTAIFMVAASLIGSFYFGAMGLASALLITEIVNFISHGILLNFEIKDEQ